MEKIMQLLVAPLLAKGWKLDNVLDNPWNMSTTGGVSLAEEHGNVNSGFLYLWGDGKGSPWKRLRILFMKDKTIRVASWGDQDVEAGSLIPNISGERLSTVKALRRWIKNFAEKGDARDNR